MVGARRPLRQPGRRRPRPDCSEPGAADPRHRAARLHRPAPVVHRRLQPRLGRHAAPRRASRRPLRPQAPAACRARDVRGSLAGLRLRALGERPDRRARRPGARCGLPVAALRLHLARALHGGGTPEGDRRLGSRQRRQLANRTDSRRLAAQQLLVGLCVS